MKVYVIVPDYGLGEGYGEPEGVFATRDLAEAAAKNHPGSIMREVFEFDVIGAAGERAP